MVSFPKFMPLYLLHPAAVHFPIAILSLGLTAALLSRLLEKPPWLAEAASWLLWLGTTFAWIAMGLGLLAEKTAPHVPAAWRTLETHETLAYWSVGLFAGLSVWRLLLGRRWEAAFLACWAVAFGVLVATAFEGGELVFSFGMGVRQ